MADERKEIMTLPLLPSDYPLFDWENWPDSRAALVAGGETRLFQKACWNAIIRTMTDGIEAAGLELYGADSGTTPESMMMLTEGYGRLTAACFNLVKACIDDILPFKYRWRWSVDRTFRGYIGRTNFIPSKQLSGGKADVVYPEYILEIVRKINLLLEILRGTGPTYDLAVKYNLEIIVFPGLRAGRGVPIIGRVSPMLLINEIPLRAGKSVPIFVPGKIYSSTQNLTMRTGKSVPIYNNIQISQPIRAAGEVKPARPVFLKGANSGSKHLIEMIAVPKGNVLIAGASSLIKTKTDAELHKAVAIDAQSSVLSHLLLKCKGIYAQPPMVIQKTIISQSNIGAGMNVALSQSSGTIRLSLGISTRAAMDLGRCGNSGTCKVISISRPESEVLLKPALHIKGGVLSGSMSQAETNAAEAQPMSVSYISAASVDATITKARARPGWVDQYCRSRSGITLDRIHGESIKCDLVISNKVSRPTLNLWALPLQSEDGTLYIRQTYMQPVKVDKTLYIDHWPEQGLTDEGTLLLWRCYDTVIQVANTLYIGSMPDTAMIGAEMLLIWDVEQEPVKTQTLLEVF